MQIQKIVITGGPCAGKTTALSWIANDLPQKGYRVVFVPETATELIGGGITPWGCGTNLDYQRCQMELQLDKERIFEQGARTIPADRVLIICDRGTMDNKAYMTEAEFLQLCEELHTSEVELRDRYDAVFHLVTAAKGATEAYTLANNAARYETVEQAAALDDRIVAGWMGHPHLRIIDNTTSFEEKLKRLLQEIMAFLGEPVPVEMERKYLIEYPDVAWLESLPNCRRVEITQTYLLSNPGEEVRVRQRGSDGHYTYYETVKKPIDGLKRIELEKKLTQKEYLKRLSEADPAKRAVTKTRYCLLHEGRYFEIDLYPFWSDRAICEIELSDEHDQVVLPPELKIIREVTDDPAYQNAALARILPEKALPDRTPMEELFRQRRFEDAVEEDPMDGFNGFRMFKIFEMKAGQPIAPALQRFLQERPDVAYCEKQGSFSRYFLKEPTYVMVGDGPTVRAFADEEKELVAACRRENIHVIGGSYTCFFDSFDRAQYYLSFEDYPGSADDAATYVYVSLDREAEQE